MNPHIVFDANEAWQHKSTIDKLEQKGVDVKIQSMPCGDFFFNTETKGFLIEHKTAKDFAASVSDGRIWRQIKKMKERQKQIGCDIGILIEGSLYLITKKSKWTMPSILGVYESIRDPAGWGVQIIGPLPSKNWTVAWILTKMNRYKRVKKDTLYALRSKLDDVVSLDEKQRYILEGIPGIGPMTAHRLLVEEGSVLNVIKNIRKISKYDGIGKKTEKTAVDIVCSKYRKKP